MKPLLTITTITLILVAGIAGAEYDFQTVFESANAIFGTSLSMAPDGEFVVAWHENNVGVWTYSRQGGDMEFLIFHGPGRRPSVCWSGWEFVLAWADGHEIHTSHGDGADWIPGATIASEFAVDIESLTLTGDVPYVSFVGSYLAWREDDGGVYFAERSGGPWSVPARLAETDGYLAGGSPKALPVAGPSGPLPRVYYLGEWEMFYFYRQSDGFLWEEPVAVDDWGYLGTYVDVTVGPDGLHHILGNGPQPTCPCNSLHYLAELPGGAWTEPELLTTGDWPAWPCIVVTPDDTVHGFFYETYWWDLIYAGEHNRYYVNADGNWYDESDAIGFPSHGAHTKVAADPRGGMFFVWARGHEDSPHVTIGFDRPISSAPAAVPAPALAAYPNPFNPTTKLRFAIRESGPARLAILDIQGRHVATLLDAVLAAGEHTATWTGCDDAGTSCPSGLYLAHLNAATSDALMKLMLIK